ncbi:glycine betaine/proline transport system substrate-binding protein [Terribacillus aidingensis]|uniref:Glycine betaine/proline transport system substrate-binding protein n=1 Tax=Terribacillus aidingensis TaxID=586416 RepID=A0A285NY17_9BACI|nr:glycine betaine ABC transporter substrate-binding protein [Terribacillus aidingensis]SNZ14380.1 glycine betaine/proline transport system substrate-binding protein [Terribacillus aidingensis]
MRKWKTLGAAAGLAMTLVAAGCGNDDSASGSFSEQVDYKITGIEAGAGVMKATEKALEDYETLEGWTLQPSSSGAMATELGNAIEDEEPIIITGWTPHWMFSKYDLKYLEDPKGSFGEEETINTMTRQGFADDMPDANKVLDQFNWTTEDMGEVMLEVSNGTDPAEAARNWVDNNPDKVAEWTDGVEKGSGDVSLAYVEWDSEVASTNVMKVVLDDLGFNTTITPIDNAVMWQSVAQGEADAMVAAWLPTTHGDLYDQYKDQVVDLGPNLEGAKTGLVVPDYVDADSIEDLEAK